MSHTLVTFLGRTRQDPNTRYQRPRYPFPGEGAPRETPFFGIALARHLQPDGAVIVGTRGSHWSVPVLHFPGGNEAQAARLLPLDAERHSTITQPMLDEVAPLMSRAGASRHAAPTRRVPVILFLHHRPFTGGSRSQ